MGGLGARSGTVIGGKWQVEELLGSGGMAEVYAATHRNGRRAALKILRREYLEKPATLRRFRREGYVANRVRHPAVVVVEDDDVCEDGAPYLVMELLEGQTLDEMRHAHAGKLPISRILTIGERLMEVLATAHQRGIVHRDIKPSNVFVTHSGNLKVLDFGIARLAEQSRSGETTAESFLGTPAYMPPEQARGRWELVDTRSDIYATGATLFTLLTGRPVHEAATRNEQLGLAMTAQARSVTSLIPGIPEHIAAVVDRALRYDRDDRWPDIESMRRAWTAQTPTFALGEPALGEVPVTSETTLIESTTELARTEAGAHATKKRTRSVIMVGCAAAAALGAILLDSRAPRSEQQHSARTAGMIGANARSAVSRSAAAVRSFEATPVLAPIGSVPAAQHASAQPKRRKAPRATPSVIPAPPAGVAPPAPPEVLTPAAMAAELDRRR